MTKAEYWFLNLVVTLRWPFGLLESADLELHVNGPGHGLSHSELVAILYRLFHDRSLIAHDESKGEIIPDRTEIEAGLAGAREIYFGLTEQGGTLWEAISQPEWNRYIDASAETDPDKVEIICSTQHLVEEYLCTQPFGKAVTGSEVWDVLSPWQATYWKTLPEGHRLRYLYQVNETDAESYDDYMQRLTEIERLNKWYVNPFD